jgi:anti-sigma regulatory factor (Ser/Thr protein kinase)/DNA-binding CsgD family transcriptional regulator
MAESFPPTEARGGASEDRAVEVRVAVYDSPLAAPRVTVVRGQAVDELVEDLAARVYTLARDRGGRIPLAAVREVVENLVHARFQDAVISILDSGNTIRVSDRGPGIADKVRALQPGFTTATAEMRQMIRGVGAGLPLAREQMALLGGTLTIDDNLGGGTVVTLTVAADLGRAPGGVPDVPPARAAELTPRQKKVLLLIAELGSAGPSAIAKELGVSQSTAYRELRILERRRLVDNKSAGRRTLTEDGIAALGDVFSA